MVIELIELFEGELHSNYIFLYFVLIGLEWDSITLFTASYLYIYINKKQSS